MGNLEDRAYDPDTPDAPSDYSWGRGSTSFRDLGPLEKIAISAASLIGAPFGFAAAGCIAGLILGFMNESDVSKIDTYGEVGAYIGAGIGTFTASLIAEEIFFEKKHENDGIDERYWETHSFLAKEKTLEHVLGKVKRLEKDLSADPDTQERAKRELNHLYANAGWCSARYAAGLALGRSKEELDTKLDLWIYWMHQGMKTTKTVLKSVFAGYTEKEVWPCKGGDDNRGGSGIVQEEVYESKLGEAPHTEQRLNCIADFDELLKLSKSSKVKKCLRKVYLKNDSPPVRRRAGKALGYSRLRIAAQEYPAMSGIASLSAIGLAAYNLWPYLV